MTRADKLPVVFEFQNGEKVECHDIRKPSQNVTDAVADWMLGMKSHRQATAGELLVAIARKPRKPEELSNPQAIAKMNAAGWITLNPKTNLWSITSKGQDALREAAKEGK